MRGAYVANRRMLAFLSICVALAFSVFYELIEWWAALSLGQGTDEFIGTQDDAWDTQSDMFMALIGTSLPMVLLAHRHDREISAQLSLAKRLS